MEALMMETKTNERETYINKLENQIQAIDKILKMQESIIVSSDVKNRLRVIQEEAAIVLKKLKNDEFEIAIVGMEKAGKSTFANALMENNFLPTDDERCTFTATQIEYSGDEQKDSALISFYSVEIFNRDFRDKLHQLGVSNYEQYSFDTLDEKTYMDIYDNDIASDKKKLYSNTLHEDILAIIQNKEDISKLLGRPNMEFEEDRIRSGEMTTYITDKVKARAVERVIIRSHELNKMRNAIIFDVPGFNSPTALHKIQTKKRMKAADAIIVVANGEHPSLTVESCSILHDSDDEGNPLCDKLFVFANRIELAKDIPKNIQNTYDEWINRNFIASSNKRRIIFGTALAHLQALEIDKDRRALNAFLERENQMPNGDGIEAMRTALEEYNHNERFEVLKRRINLIKVNIEKVFSEIRKDYTGGDTHNRYYGQEHLRLVTKFCHDIPPAVEENLLELKSEIRSDMPADLPLSKQIIKYIDEKITIDNYAISDEIIDKEKKKSPYTGTFEDTVRIEDSIRKQKFSEMYDNFCQNVINIADKYHVKYSVQILDSILEAMEVEKKSVYYEELRELLTKELIVFRHELATTDDVDEQIGVYYQSLIERFSRDIYEVLITSQYSAERLRKFYDSIDNFFSLSVFYKRLDEADKISYINVAPQDQPLCRMLLFHQTDKFEVLIEQISKIAGLDILSDDLVIFVQRALSAVGGNTEKIITDITNAFSRTRIDTEKTFKINLIKQILDGIIKSCESFNIADKEEFTGYYKKYHSSLRGNKQYSVEDFRDEFNKDIEILQDVLRNAFVRAINMETPFVARETKSIDDIINYIKSGQFTEFLTNNFVKIKHEETFQLDKKYREHEQNVAIIAEVNAVLDTINN